MYVRDVDIIGDSFPNRLLRDLEKQNKDRNLDLHPYEQANVLWYTRGGLTLSKLHSMRGWIMLDMQEITILHIGSNVLCTMPVDAFLRQMSKETIPMLRELDFRVIVVAQIFCRRTGHFTKDQISISTTLRWMRPTKPCPRSVSIMWFCGIIYKCSDRAPLTKYGIQMASILILQECMCIGGPFLVP